MSTLPDHYAVRSSTTVEAAHVTLRASRFAAEPKDTFSVVLEGKYGNSVHLSGTFSEVAACLQAALGVLTEAVEQPALEYRDGVLVERSAA